MDLEPPWQRIQRVYVSYVRLVSTILSATTAKRWGPIRVTVPHLPTQQRKEEQLKTERRKGRTGGAVDIKKEVVFLPKQAQEPTMMLTVARSESRPDGKWLVHPHCCTQA